MFITTPNPYAYQTDSTTPYLAVHNPSPVVDPYNVHTREPALYFPSGFSMPMNHFEEMCKSFMSKNYPEELI